MVLNEVKIYLPGIKSEPTEENFLTKYEPAIIELVLEGKHLSEVNIYIQFSNKHWIYITRFMFFFGQICPLVAVCPTDQQIKAWKQIPDEFTEKSSIQEKPNCPLCLFAVTKLYEIVKDQKSEVSYINDPSLTYSSHDLII